MSLADALSAFESQFEVRPTHAARAPGRVNIIGEHTDYQDGFVLPMAIDRCTVVVGRRSEDNDCRVVSVAGGETRVARFVASRSMAPPAEGEVQWSDYVRGVLAQYRPYLPATAPMGCALAIVSDVPLGGGLSSSASLEVAIATLVEAMFHHDLVGSRVRRDKARGAASALHELDGVGRALRCQRAEHEFAHMPCGIMDQFVSSLGVRGNALLIDCRSHEAQLVPLDDESVVFVITNSNVKHELSGSEYPDRVRQCREALEVLARHQEGVRALRDCSPEDVTRCQAELGYNAFRRALHVTSENARVGSFVDAMRARDYAKAGALMCESHASLRDNFEVSTRELDALVEIAMQVPGVFGARMTGGGFGGCTITLCKSWAVPVLVERLCTEYAARTGVECTVVATTAAQGAEELSLAASIPSSGQAGRGEDEAGRDWVTLGATGLVALALVAAAVPRLRVWLRR